MAYLLIQGQYARALWKYQGKIEASPGSCIEDACAELVALAAERGEPITIDFNGTPITATGTEDPEALRAEWSAEMDRKAEAYYNSEEYKALEAAAEAHATVREATLNAMLATAPEKMTLANPKRWGEYVAANTDGYGRGILAFAELWARFMEARMNAGASLADCARETSSLADVDGITGFMYGAAVHILAQCWIHGDALRRWHNLDTQIGTEGERANETGGTLNPALLSIG